jgi:hypothetical protein
MPWMNGRFYANPFFGRALERARMADSGQVWSAERPEMELQSSSQTKTGSAAPSPTSQHSHGPQPNHQKAIEKKASAGYGETSGLLPQALPHAKGRNAYDRSTWDKNSFDQLQEARRNIIDVSERNPKVRRAKPGDRPHAIEKSVWGDNQHAASRSGGSLPGNFFFMRQAGVGPQRPPKDAGFGQGEPVRSYGPFRNVGGGSVPKGDRTYIDIYDR